MTTMDSKGLKLYPLQKYLFNLILTEIQYICQIHHER